jgi:PHP domain
VTGDIVILAALHMHSTFSDGEFAMPELRDIFVRAGCRIIAITDHADAFDAERLQRYVEECERLSDRKLTILPGLEFGCVRRMHILGFGVTQLCESDDPVTVIRHIRASGGVAVIAHPKNEFFEWIRGFEELPDGIEAWNSKYDGRQAPRTGTFDLIRELRSREPGLNAFYGIDLHWRNQYRDLHVELDLTDSEVSRTNILDALRAGRFHGRTDEFSLASDGSLDAQLRERFDRVHRRHMRLRSALVRAKRFADSIGLRAPEGLKAQLRRLF